MQQPTPAKEAVFAYWEVQFDALESRLRGTTRYVELCQDNASAYSYEYASILRDACSLFDSVMRHVVVFAGQVPAGSKTSIKDYREWILGLPLQHGFAAFIENPYSIVRPFDGFEAPDRNPSWWHGYTDLKHDGYRNRSAGSLANAVRATCAAGFCGIFVAAADQKVSSLMNYSAMTHHTRLFGGAGDVDFSTMSPVPPVLFP